MRARKLLPLILPVITVALSLAGCGKTDVSNQTGNTVSDKKTEGNMQTNGLPILKTPETYVIAFRKSPQSKNNMQEKEPVKYAEKQTNVKIDWMEIPSSGWTEKVNIMFASGDLPAAFIGGVDIMKNLSSLVPLNEPIEKYAQNVKRIFSDKPDLKKALMGTDGKIYSLPTGGDVATDLINNNMWINKNWLDKLNLKMPTTTDEFYDVLKAFRDKDPNGNGKPDEIPFCPTSANGSSVINYMFGAFGTLDSNNHIKVQGGKVIFTPAEEGYFEGLKWLHKLYSERLMNQDYFTEQFQQYKAKGDNPEVIIGVAMDWYSDNIISVDKASQYKLLLPLKGPKGDQLWGKSSEPMANLNGFTITKKCKNPEVLVRWYDFNNSSLEIVNTWLLGPEGTGCWHKIDGNKWEMLLDNIPKGSSFAEYRRTIGTGPEGPIYTYSRYGDLEKLIPRYQEKLEAVNACLPFTPKEVMPVGLEDPAMAGERNLLQTDINNYLKSFNADCIIQGIDNAKWQEHLNKLKSLKVDQYTKLWQDFYNSHK